MTAADAIQTFLSVLAVIVGLPMLVVIVRVGMFFGSLSRSVSALESAATSFTQKVDKVLEKLVDQGNDHEVRLQLIELFVDAERIKRGEAPDRRHPREIARLERKGGEE